MSANRIRDWLDERTGYRARLNDWLDSPIAGGARWAYAIGSLVGYTFFLLAATGVLLMTVYAPSPEAAWASVHYANEKLSGGWIVRGLHYFASHALIVLVGLHLAYLVVAGGYKKPRELYFWLTLALVGMVMGLAITGHLLPWDQQGYWARKVEANIVGMAPFGAKIQSFLQGGADLGALSLTRAYAAHVALLPALFIVVLLVRRFAVPKDAPVIGGGSTPSAPRFRQLSRNIVAAALLALALLAFVMRTHGAPLDAPADPASDYPARPEWFLLPLFQLRKYFHGAGEFWGTAGIPAFAGLYLFALPFWDRAPTTDLRKRAGVLAPFAGIGLGIVVLGWLAVRGEADPKLALAKQKAESRARAAYDLATREGVPPAGPLEMLRNDPSSHGEALFEKHCASCHLLGDLGDPKEAHATKLDGWSTEPWLKEMIHAPDDPKFFGTTPYKGEMPSQDTAKEGDPVTLKNAEELSAVAAFLAAEGLDAPEPAAPAATADLRAKGEKIVKERCTGCHKYEGEGDDEGSEKAPELSKYGSIAWVAAQIANPSSPSTYRDHASGHDKVFVEEEGKKKELPYMPGFQEELSAADIDVLARWTRAKARGVPLVKAPAAPAPPQPKPSPAPSASGSAEP